MLTNKLQSIWQVAVLYGRLIIGTVLLGGIASLMGAVIFQEAHRETAVDGATFIEGPLWPLLLFMLLIIFLFSLLFASLQFHAYWVRKQEKTAVHKSSFVRMASDTLRTPLTGLRWTTELMLSGEYGNITAKQKEGISNMDTAIGRVIGLVNELLEVMRLSGGIINYQPEPTSVPQMIRSAVGDMQSVAGTKYVKIGYGQISHEVLIMMDAPLIRHVLSTLLAGAIHLSKSESIVVVHAEPTETKIAIGITYKGEKIAFKNYDASEKSIQRSALPINLDNLDLAISWEILNAAAGEFWMVDKDDEHTLFIGLPLKEAPKGAVVRERKKKLDAVVTKDADVSKFLAEESE